MASTPRAAIGDVSRAALGAGHLRRAGWALWQRLGVRVCLPVLAGPQEETQRAKADQHPRGRPREGAAAAVAPARTLLLPAGHSARLAPGPAAGSEEPAPKQMRNRGLEST